MKISKLFLSLLLLVPSLCSFTDVGNGDGIAVIDDEQTKLDQDLEALDSDLDMKTALKDDYDLLKGKGIENQLTKEDISIFRKAVNHSGTHIFLDDSIYASLPINRQHLSLEDYKEKFGEPTYTLTDSTEFAYYVNYKKINFVEQNMELMNSLVDIHEGEIVEDEFVFYSKGRSAVRQMRFDLSIKWFSISGNVSSSASVLLGAFGLFINLCDFILNIDDFLKASATELKSGFLSMESDLLGELSQYSGSEFFSNLMDIVSLTKSVLDIVSTTSIMGLALKILKFIVSRYLPGTTKGGMMVLSAFKHDYGAKVTVGIFWSDYEILLDWTW